MLCYSTLESVCKRSGTVYSDLRMHTLPNRSFLACSDTGPIGLSAVTLLPLLSVPRVCTQL
jgi:hypothetical protein